MDSLHLAATDDSPHIILDPKTGVAELTGDCYPENARLFFAPIVEWVRGYLAAGEPLRLDLKPGYLNASSVRCLLEIVELMERRGTRRERMQVNWYYEAQNQRALHMAEEFGEGMDVDFSVIAVDGEAVE